MNVLYQPLPQRRDEDSTHNPSIQSNNYEMTSNPVHSDIEESKQTSSFTPLEIESSTTASTTTTPQPSQLTSNPRRYVNVVNLHDGIVARNRQNSEKTWQYVFIFLFFSIIGALTLFYLLDATSSPSILGDDYYNDDSYTNSASNKRYFSNVSTIAFGSCSSYDLRDLHIFNDAILPSEPKPDAWIWAGDMVYLDESDLNCYVYENTPDWQMTCNCTPNWFQTNPTGCHAADVEYAQRRWMKGLNNAPYNDFLQYMCPKSLEQGIFPPDGSNPTLCDRPIFGIYDDHDFGWNNGNEREKDKRVFKNLYLDAIGEPMTSIRRNSNRGAWTSYHLNIDEGSKNKNDNNNKLIDVIVLDERYEREMIPCDTRRDYCEKIVLQQHSSDHTNTTIHRIQPSSVSANELAWCKDFLQGGPYKQGTCCKKDEEIFFGWCQRPNHKHHPYYRDVCDVTYANFGRRSLIYDPIRDDIVDAEFMVNDNIDESQVTPFCEVLGKQQRQWLRTTLPQSKAPVKLFISGSVLLYDPSWHVCGTYSMSHSNGSTSEVKEVQCRCGGDNLDCYRVAQRELLHLISQVKGCAIVLTGDYHFSDIKVLKNGKEQVYSDFEYYDSKNNAQSIYQIMSSGLSSSTAKEDLTCEDYRLDPMGLRTHSECSFVRGPNFGKVLFEYEHQHQGNGKNEEVLKKITLQILSGKIANKVLLETVIDPKTCNPL